MLAFLPLVVFGSLVTSVVSRAVTNIGLSQFPQAIYTLANDETGAYVVSLAISENGKISAPVKTSTRGRGLLGVQATGVNKRDGLFGQDAIVVAGNYLFTVNPGTHTVSMFTIDPYHPTRLTLIGTPADTLGEFPISVAYSALINQVCVLNGGRVGGVTCFSVDPYKGLLAVDKAPRDLGPALNQTTPAFGPPGTASSLKFSPSGSYLLAIVKGDGMKVPSTYYVWSAATGSVETAAVTTQIPGELVTFGGPFLDETHLLSTDATYGASIVQITPSFTVQEETHVVIANQSAICWAAYYPGSEVAYVPDSGLSLLHVFNASSGGLISTTPFDPALGGGFDSVMSPNHMYMLTGVGSVAVWDLTSIAIKQVFNLTAVAGNATDFFQGIALY